MPRLTRRTLLDIYALLLVLSTIARWWEGAFEPRDEGGIVFGCGPSTEVLVSPDAGVGTGPVAPVLEAAGARHRVTVVGTRVDLEGELAGHGRPVHLVAIGTGGVPAILAAARRPDLVRSLTLIDAVGIEEFDLLGDHHLNQVLRRAEVMLFDLVRWGVPHFGTLNRPLFQADRARALLALDRRGIRTALLGWRGPTLILTGSTDPTTIATAREHARLAPQSLSGSLDPGTLASFLDAVDRGAAPTRATASPARIAAAARPFDAGGLASAQGISLLVVLGLLALATLLSEDLACVAAGVLAARGSIPLWPAILACYIGIVAGDQLLYLLGRSLGRAIVTRRPVRWLLTAEDLDRACAWFDRQGMRVVLTSRFLPGTRFPVYVAAGVLRAGFVRFAVWLMAIGAIWTPALVGASFLAGRSGRDLVESLPGATWPWAVGSVVLMTMGVRVALALAGRRGRGRA